MPNVEQDSRCDVGVRRVLYLPRRDHERDH